jgi:hypothetical protein
MKDRITDSKSSGLRGIAIFATTIGAVAVGAFAIGALAIRKLAVSNLVIENAKFKSLEIQDLTVTRLHAAEIAVSDSIQFPPDEPLADPLSGGSSVMN